jgi:hypothetical protein
VSARSGAPDGARGRTLDRARLASGEGARRPRPYADPYLAGVALGLVLLAAFLVAGRGLGASGAFASGAAALVARVDPARAEASAVLAPYRTGGGFSRDWLVFEMAGVVIGGALSAAAAGRWRLGVERGPRLTSRARLVAAFAGGAGMGVAAVLARGCTSGLALTGGALLGAGAWAFLLTAFATAHLAGPVLGRLWR